MMLIGAAHLDDLIAGRSDEAKMVLNNQGAIVFSVRHQHREMKAAGISYEDDYAGNALAAMVRRDAIEIRFHRAYDDRAVARLIGHLLALPEFSGFVHAKVTYQGRVVKA